MLNLSFLLDNTTVLAIVMASSISVMTLKESSLMKEGRHAATAINVKRTTELIQLYKTIRRQHPDQWDGLIAYSDGVPVIYDKFSTENNEVEMAILTDFQAESLSDAGITKLSIMNSDPHNATYDASTKEFDSVRPNTPVVQLTQNISEREFNGGADWTYLIFGLGPNCTMIGDLLLETPVHLHDKKEISQYYARLLAVYRVPSVSSGRRARAQFMGVLTADGNGIKRISSHLTL